MDWSTIAAAFIGGIFGGGLGSLVSYLQPRTGRRAALDSQRWRDAEVVADVWELLSDVLPQRREFNVSFDAAEENQKSAVLDERQRQISRTLMRFAAGHPSTEVRRAARPLASALDRATSATDWLIRDIQNARPTEHWLGMARSAHAEATDLAMGLEAAVNSAGEKRKPGRRQRLGNVPATPGGSTSPHGDSLG